MIHFVWLWISIVIIALIVEVFTEQLVSIWFVPASLVSAVLSLFKVGILWQVLIFAVLSIVGVFVGKLILSKKSKEDTRTNIEAIIGEHCVVSERIDNYAGRGQVKIKGQVWSARGINENDTFEIGEILTVVSIEGVKLICK